jgi:hypothetical protein
MLPARRRNEIEEYILKILKRDIRYIIKKLTDWKDFVFANPLCPSGQFGKPTHILTHNSNFEKSLNFSMIHTCIFLEFNIFEN